MPAAGVLRFVPPSAYLAVLQKVRAALDGPGANEGFELARALSGFSPSARAAAQWAHNKGVSDESGRALRKFAVAMGSPQKKARAAAFQRRILARKLQRRYVGLDLQMRETRVSVLELLQSPQVGPWPSELLCAGSLVCT